MMTDYAQIEPNTYEFIEIANLADLPNGERLFVEVDDQRIVIFNIAGQLFAISDVCSHDDGPVGEGDLEDHTVVCPRHGARFDIHTGKALELPAVIDIPTYPVRVRDSMIEVGIPLNLS
jgi:3-phenylpropionate/trans-cinnamate dioxygenase ferredoxin component